MTDVRRGFPPGTADRFGWMVLLVVMAVGAIYVGSRPTPESRVILDPRPCSGVLVLDGRAIQAQMCGNLAPRGETVILRRDR